MIRPPHITNNHGGQNGLHGGQNGLHGGQNGLYSQPPPPLPYRPPPPNPYNSPLHNGRGVSMQGELF